MTDLPPSPSTITGLVLAGGRGSRMGGVDKGLQLHRGQPLALHALQRLAPQVGGVMLSANRNLARYETMGVPVWPDALPGHPGPLAGLLAGLVHCPTPWLVSVPCDAPHFPPDLVQRLAGAVLADTEIVLACSEEDGVWRAQPVFCLLRRTLRTNLEHYLGGGERHALRWVAQQRGAEVLFEDAAAFVNVNTLAELQRAGDETAPR